MTNSVAGDRWMSGWVFNVTPLSFVRLNYTDNYNIFFERWGIDERRRISVLDRCSLYMPTCWTLL